MSTSNSQVAHVWAQGNRSSAKGSNFTCSANSLYSYGTCVGTIIEGVIFISSDNMTPSTGKQLSYARRAAAYNCFATPAFTYGKWDAPSAAECIIAAAEEMTETFNKICRMRTYVTESVERYEQRRAKILELAERFQVAELPAMPEATGDLKEKARALAKKEREKKAADLKRKEENERAQRILDRGELDLWLQHGRGRYPSSFRKRGEDQITLKNGYQRGEGLPHQADAVITSQGAEAPLDHVIKALKFYDSRKYTAVTINGADPETAFSEYHTNGHKIALGHFTLDSIDEAGNVKAGCHNFTAAEITRFRAQWGL